MTHQFLIGLNSDDDDDADHHHLRHIRFGYRKTYKGFMMNSTQILNFPQIVFQKKKIDAKKL